MDLLEFETGDTEMLSECAGERDEKMLGCESG